MKKQQVSALLVGLISAFGITACSSGSTSSSSSEPTEQGVAVFNPGSSVSESPIWVATKPSSNNWFNYTSGTTNKILAMAANSTVTLLFDGTNLFLSPSNDSNFKLVQFTGGPLVSATLVAGPNGFVMYSGNQMWQITNSGTITQVSSLTSNVISSLTYVANFESQFYAYTSQGTVYSSPDGQNWTLTTGQNIQGFTQVIQLGSNLFAAMIPPAQDNPNGGNLWLGTSPTSFNSPNENLNNFFGVPAQINFMATDGNNDLYLNETVSATNHTIRLYKIANASQQDTGPLLSEVVLPNDSNTVKPSNIFVTPSTIYIPTGTTTTPNGNDLDPNGPTSLTAVANIQQPTLTTQVVGSPSQTNGVVYTIQGTSLLLTPDNNGDLTLITNASNPASPNYQVLPSGAAATYAAVKGSTTNYMLFLNNGGVLLPNSSNSFTPTAAITDTSNPQASAAITNVLSAASINGSYLVQATSTTSSTTSAGNLYFSSNGSSWTTIPQSSLTSANLGVLVPNAVTVNNINGMYNITTESSNNSLVTYQTSTPANLATWVATPYPSPFISVNGSTYALYAESTQVGLLSGSQYNIIANALPQNYVSSGNIAVNPSSGLIALAQPATEVSAVGKITGSNYVWTASIFDGSWLSSETWTLNTATFSNLQGQSLPTENFNINPVLLWNGKMWFSQGNGGVLQNTSNLPTSVYTSSNAISWQAVGSESGVPIFGVPFLF